MACVEAIRADEQSRSLPVILLSARAGEEARIEGLNAGADEYLVKPFTARELLACVASQLALSRMRRETERELRDADRRKDEFLALLAHELRNPLAPIRTGLELIRLSGDTPQSVRRVRSLMVRQLGHMVRLIDDLLDVSRIASGKIVLQRVPTALAELVQNAVDAQRAAIASARIELIVDLVEPSCVLDVDPTRLVQVLSNVLHNAAKFTPPEGKIASFVRDSNGCGLTCPTGRDHRLRHRHRHLERDAPAGLRIVHAGRVADRALSRWARNQAWPLLDRLIEMHGGRRSPRHSDGPGTGSSFVISLPVCTADAQRLSSVPMEAPTCQQSGLDRR